MMMGGSHGPMTMKPTLNAILGQLSEKRRGFLFNNLIIVGSTPTFIGAKSEQSNLERH